MLRLASLLVVVLGGRAAAAPPPTVGVLDLRPPDAPAPLRAETAAELGRRGLAGPEPALAEALAGERSNPALAAALATHQQALIAYGKLRCDEARARAREAALELLAAAPPDEVATELIEAFTIELLCADAAGDRAAARAAADRLRGLGQDPPPNVSAAVWARYPQVDAALVVPAQLRVGTDPPGARVWIDLREVGVAPVQLAVTPGEHWVLVAAPGRRPFITVVTLGEREQTTTHLALSQPPPDAWADLRARVAGWRAGALPRTSELTSLMRDLGLDVVVVLHGEWAEVWQLVPRAVSAKPVGKARALDVTAVADLAAGAARPDGARAVPLAPSRSPSPSPPPKRRSPWVIGVAVGVVLVGAGLVYFSQTGEDIQRIEVTFP